MQHLYEYGAVPFHAILELIEEMQEYRRMQPMPALSAEGAALILATFR
jgi:hypothetical protein